MYNSIFILKDSLKAGLFYLWVCLASSFLSNSSHSWLYQCWICVLGQRMNKITKFLSFWWWRKAQNIWRFGMWYFADIDECRISLVSICSPGVCINEPGTFRCDCGEGYRGIMMNQMCVGKLTHLLYVFICHVLLVYERRYLYVCCV